MLKVLNKKNWLYGVLFVFLITLIFAGWSVAQETAEDYEEIDSRACLECHETSKHETVIEDDLSHSAHDGLECLDCHINKGTMPHTDTPDFAIGFLGCGSCHEDKAKEYIMHGRVPQADDTDTPDCADCHGDHDVLPSTAKLSKTHPSNLTETCGVCHKDLDLIQKHDIRTGHPLEVYDSSIHGTSVQGGELGAATCNDCHSTEGTAHKIFSAGNLESSIYHFNIPKTCGKCHVEAAEEYGKGIHGQLLARGDTESPVCTHCHGEHGILSPSDPRSPVSRTRLAEGTCTPCHESISLTEKYGVSTGRIPSYIDSYHGLKTKAGDLFVANCSSCHGYHLMLPSSDPKSSVHPDNLQKTCGECHPGISAELAATPIHEMQRTIQESRVAGIVKTIYILAIIVIIGAMAVHWLIDLVKQIRLVMRKQQVRRMRPDEVWQHTLLMVSFIVLAITGFALRYEGAGMTRLLFGWDHGFEIRGLIHRVAALVLMAATFWHVVFLFTQRGRRFFKDMFPEILDIRHFFQRVGYNLGISKMDPQFKRFSYVEKAEYWALVWGNVVMIVTGLLLWFDNFFIKFLHLGFLEVSQVIHFYEAILATLAILIWHLYSTVFNPHVYPMNPSWLTGKMPRDMFEHEHPDAEIEEIE